MKAQVSTFLAIVIVSGAALAAPSAPKQIAPSSVKKFLDFKKKTKPIEPKDKPTTKPVKIPGSASMPWCGLRVDNGQWWCEPPDIKCVSSILLSGGPGQPNYVCDIDCHGQTEAGPDGTCDCDIKYDTCKVAP